jgi:carbon storage regulator CsrA
MLVLSRRSNEKLILPTLGVTIHVLGVKGGTVKIGIEAPPEVRVLREELIQDGAGQPGGRRPSLVHALRNHLNKLSLMLHVFERQWHAGSMTEAELTLEKALAQLKDLGQLCAPPSAPPGPAPGKPRLRSLVIEDDKNERELLAGLLRMNGAECETAADGIEALAYLESHERPDVVLLDMWMPRCDGKETLARIRRDPRFVGLKVFAVSGTRPQDLGIRSGPEGVDGWFPKPLNPRQLWEAIQDSLASPSTKN